MKVAAKVMASTRLSTGNWYVQGRMGGWLKALRTLLALMAWSSSCCWRRQHSKT